MDLEIRPEPSAAERRAIELALRRLLREPAPSAYESRWRAAGVATNADPSPASRGLARNSPRARRT